MLIEEISDENKFHDRFLPTLQLNTSLESIFSNQ